MKIAILVDGGYYRKRSASVLGHKTAKARADELYSYCNQHLKETSYGNEIRHELYRIFYRDSLSLHIDGLRTCDNAYLNTKNK
ncbi:TPA: hypothetical protein U1Z55_000987 [Streptococcus suis]|nr:hypothetical protein [Streptococcus suis]